MNQELAKELAAYKLALDSALGLDCDNGPDRHRQLWQKKESLLKSARHIAEVNPWMWDGSSPEPQAERAPIPQP